VAYPESEAGDLITIQSEDGGGIDGKQIVKQFHLDEARHLSFTFTSTMEGGVYRITLRKGFDEKRLEFWGGPVPEIQRPKS
jgi:hypothetical protein